MYSDIIKDKGLSVTSKRIALLEVLGSKRQPMTIEMINQSLSVSMDKSTIYRSLKKLVDHGIVYQTDFRDGASYFELQGEHHHHHVVCTECKARQPINICIDKKFHQVEKETGYTITNHMFELFGLCKDCS